VFLWPWGRANCAQPSGQSFNGWWRARLSLSLKDGQPLAVVMIQHEEAERWRRIENSLAALHAMNIYPEALNDPPSSRISPISRRPDYADDPQADRRAARDPVAPPNDRRFRCPRRLRDPDRGGRAGPSPNHRRQPPSRRDHPSGRIRPTPRASASSQLVPRRRPWISRPRANSRSSTSSGHAASRPGGAQQKAAG